MTLRGPSAGRPADQGDAGVAGVLVTVLAAVLAAVAFGGAAVVGAVAARHRAGSVADLAALAAASRWWEGSAAACARAGVVAEHGGARLLRCEWSGGRSGSASPEVEVLVEVSGPRWPIRGGPARARARAGTVVAQ